MQLVSQKHVKFCKVRGAMDPHLSLHVSGLGKKSSLSQSLLQKALGSVLFPSSVRKVRHLLVRLRIFPPLHTLEQSVPFPHVSVLLTIPKLQNTNYSTDES